MPVLRPSARSLVPLLVVLLAAVWLQAQPTPTFGSLVALPDHEGTFEWTATGAKGGRFVIRYQFRGFYVWSAPLLSTITGAGLRQLPADSTLADEVKVFPMYSSVSVNGTASSTTTFEDGRNRTDCWTSTHSVNTQWTEEAPPFEQMQAVLLHHAPPPTGFVLPLHFDISDRRTIGGAVQLTSLQVGSPMTEAQVPTQATFTDYDAPGDVDRTAAAPGTMGYLFTLQPKNRDWVRAELGYTGTRTPHVSLWFDADGPMPLPNDFSLETLKLTGRVSGKTRTPLRSCSYLKDDEPFSFEATWMVAVPQRIEATLEPVDPREADWVPSLDDVREYRVRFTNPGPEGIGALRVRLAGTSSHPGIATNAGNHNVEAPLCFSCTRAVEQTPHQVSQDFHGIPVTRHYHGINECVLDHLPDMFFVDGDNEGFVLVDPETTDLRTPIAQSILLGDVTTSEVIVRLRVKDWAASARLIAEVDLGGTWVPVRATGPTADPLGTELQVPRDADRDGIADFWESVHSAFDPRADTDNIPGAVHLGDGLTNFEEYRGIYALGQFVRPDPEQKTIFVHDYTGRRLPAVQRVRAFYLPQGLQVLSVDGSEFREDVINYQSGSAQAGAQYITVLMENPARPDSVGWRAFAEDWLTFAGMASHVGPPQQGANTMALQYRIETRSTYPWQVVGHELGHLMGVAHHGETDTWVTLDEATPSGIPAGRHLAAFEGGQHSGDFNCIMKYEAALLFCKTPRALPYSHWFYDDYPLQLSRPVTGLCTAAAGTGTNAAGAWAGNATVGNCTAQVRVRSYR